MSQGNSPNAAADSQPNFSSGSPVQTQSAPLPIGAALAVCAGGLLIPGLGHILLKRWVRGVIFAFCILMMFVLGLGMQGKLYDLAIREPLHIFALFADIGVGLPYWVAERLELGYGVMEARTFDYGTTYLWVAGLLNYLVVLDAFDIAKGRKP